MSMPCYICFADDLSYDKSAYQLHTGMGIDNEAGNAVDRNPANMHEETSHRAQRAQLPGQDRVVEGGSWWSVQHIQN